EFESRQDFESAMQAELEAAEIELVCLAGFMRLLTDGFVRSAKHFVDKLFERRPLPHEGAVFFVM
ncbi:MAG: formyltransferase family protein, partial [Verrucomicrobiota bacterium]